MSKGRRYAVLIGSGNFDKEPKLTTLKCPGNDVDGMREILAAAELGAFEEPFVFKNAESHVVARQIGKILAEAGNHDHVLIYYSGHGETDLPGHLYLATADTEVNNLIATSIPVDLLQVMISRSSCRKIMLILDCCYGGAAGRSFTIRGSIDENLKELARGSGVYILTASTASQTAQEREGDDYGLLTKHIISGIRQGAADADDDGLVSMDDLYRYVYTKVKSEGYQEPMRWALNVKGEDLIIARVGGMSIGERRRQSPAQKPTSLSERRPQLIRWIVIAAAALFLVVVAWAWKRQTGVNLAQPSRSAGPSVSPTDQKLGIEPSPASTPAPTVKTMPSPSQTPAVKSLKSVRDEKVKKADKIIEEERIRQQP